MNGSYAVRRPAVMATIDADVAGTFVLDSEDIGESAEIEALGGMLRTGVEDTFYLPGGERTSGNGQLIEALAACARRAGREVASPAEARAMLGLKAASEHGVLA